MKVITREDPVCVKPPISAKGIIPQEGDLKTVGVSDEALLHSTESLRLVGNIAGLIKESLNP
ncbi:MAG: hypothetical protein ABH851_03540, partial [Methanobacteriota archaeon]